MVAKLTSRRNALWLFALAVAFMLVITAIIFLTPPRTGGTGIYIVAAFDTLTRVYIVAYVLLIVSIILYGIRSRSLSRTVPLLLAVPLIILPIMIENSTSFPFQAHVDSLTTQDHAYQLAENMFLTCPDSFDATYTCYNRVFLYECDTIGVLCSVKNPDGFLVQRDKSINLRFEDNQIKVINDQNEVVYTMPS